MSDITEILDSDQVSASRSVINENFDNLNTDKLEKTSNLSDLANAATARTNLGLGNVNNTSDTNKPVSTAQQTALDSKIDTTETAGPETSILLNLGDQIFHKIDDGVDEESEFSMYRYGYEMMTDSATVHNALFIYNFDPGLYYFKNGASGVINGIFDFSDIASTSKTFTFPNNTGTIALASDIPTQEIIEDYVGAMVTGNTETGISVTYNDGTGKLDFDAQTAGDARYAPIAKGVTNGDSHDHSGGDGAQVNHANLSNVGTNTHTQIDTHIASQRVIYKSADETVNNSSVLQNDDHLTFAVNANEVWAFRLFLIFQSGTTPDFKYKWSVPAGATSKSTRQGFFSIDDMTTDQTWSTTGLGTDDVLDITGVITISSTAGNITLQWAQNVTNASDTKVLKGSHIIAHRLA